MSFSAEFYILRHLLWLLFCKGIKEFNLHIGSDQIYGCGMVYKVSTSGLTFYPFIVSLVFSCSLLYLLFSSSQAMKVGLK